jgi:hypothetical protein
VYSVLDQHVECVGCAKDGRGVQQLGRICGGGLGVGSEFLERISVLHGLKKRLTTISGVLKPQ